MRDIVTGELRGTGIGEASLISAHALSMESPTSPLVKEWFPCEADFVVSIHFRQRDPGITAGTYNRSHGLHGEGKGGNGQAFIQGPVLIPPNESKYITNVFGQIKHALFSVRPGYLSNRVFERIALHVDDSGVYIAPKKL